MPSTAPAQETEPVHRSLRGRAFRVYEALKPTILFWMETETHVYSFSIAANVLLSFFPLLIVMASFCRYVLKWQAASDAFAFAMNDFFPGPINQFLTQNLNFAISSRGPFQAISLLVLLFTANGIFQPLEVAFNRVWRCETNRSYIKNQLFSFGLIFACGGLLLASTLMTAADQQSLASTGSVSQMLLRILNTVFYKLAAIPVSMLVLFLVYWLLPNCKVPGHQILPAAIGVGFLLEILRYVNLLTWPLLRDKFAAEYGPFTYSATLILWSFLASMIVLAGAEWAARRARG